MIALTDPWHFPRPDLAQSYLRSFDLGLTSARRLFARRRMGKSEFLKHDLLPAAMHDGYLAAYTKTITRNCGFISAQSFALRSRH